MGPAFCLNFHVIFSKNLKFVLETAMSLSLLLYLCSQLSIGPKNQAAPGNAVYALLGSVWQRCKYFALQGSVSGSWGLVRVSAAYLYSCFNIMIIIIYLYNSAVCMTVITLRE